MEENSLSIVGLIFNAGLVVQLVMIILVDVDLLMDSYHVQEKDSYGCIKRH